MSQLHTTINICDLCRHVWLSKITPKHCANRKCASREWNGVKRSPKPSEVLDNMLRSLSQPHNGLVSSAEAKLPQFPAHGPSCQHMFQEKA